MQYMRKLIGSIDVRPLQSESAVAAEFGQDAMLRFGDATRQAIDGALWKLGSDRPQAIVAMEFTGTEDKLQLNYEFLCLTPQKFELRTGNGWIWRPRNSALTFQRLPGVPAPHQSPSFRLRQMKQLAKRFSVTERLAGEDFRLRLMPQPIDRYVIKETGDFGAVFVFANGTNPEVLLLLETVDQEWQYGLARMCGAAPMATFDGRKVWDQPSMDEVGKSWQLDYTGDAHPVALPATSGD